MTKSSMRLEVLPSDNAHEWVTGYEFGVEEDGSVSVWETYSQDIDRKGGGSVVKLPPRVINVFRAWLIAIGKA